MAYLGNNKFETDHHGCKIGFERVFEGVKLGRSNPITTEAMPHTRHRLSYYINTKRD